MHMGCGILLPVHVLKVDVKAHHVEFKGKGKVKGIGKGVRPQTNGANTCVCVFVFKAKVKVKGIGTGVRPQTNGANTCVCLSSRSR